MTMTGLAATLDTIAEAPGVEEARSSGLHKVLIMLGDVNDGSPDRLSVDLLLLSRQRHLCNWRLG